MPWNELLLSDCQMVIPNSGIEVGQQDLDLKSSSK